MAFVVGAQQPLAHSVVLVQTHCWFEMALLGRQTCTPFTPGIGAQHGFAALVQSELVVHLRTQLWLPALSAKQKASALQHDPAQVTPLGQAGPPELLPEEPLS